jgi:uncharacterized protein
MPRRPSLRPSRLARELPRLPHLPALACDPCKGCDRCCRYVALEIDRPTTREDFDQIRWYVLHRNVSVFIVDSGDWYVQFDTACEWLKDERCTHYELRPELCREYDPESCERHGEGPGYEILIENEADLERYLDRRWRRKRRGASRPLPAAGVSEPR